MSTRPLVTIAIPAYKARHLHESLASALSQTYENIEVVVVNDQSPDDVASVVSQFDDPRIRYFENRENLGKGDPSKNWNECLRLARGEWFCLLCDDDVYDARFVEELLRVSERYPQCDVLRSGVVMTDGEGRELSTYPVSPEFETVEQYLWDFFHSRRRQTIGEFMLRRSAIVQAGGYVNLPYAWGSDNLSIFHFALQNGIASTPLPLMTFRDSGENISSDCKHMDEKLMAFQEYIRLTKEMVRKEGFRQDLLPVLDDYYRRAAVAHMVGASAEDLRRIVRRPKAYHIGIKGVLKALLRRWFLSH